MVRVLSFPAFGAGFLAVGTLGPLVALAAPSGPVAGLVLLAAGAAAWGYVALADGIVATVGRTPLANALAFAPIATVLAVELLAALAVAPSRASDLGGFVGMGVGGGAVLVSAAQKRSMDEAIGEEAPIAAWRARPAPDRHRQRVVAGVALLAVPAGYVLAWLARRPVDLPLSFSLLLVVLVLPGVLGGVALAGLLPGEHEAYESGLRLAATSTVLNRFVPAPSLAGCSVTGEALVVHRDARWLPDLRFRREDVDDLEGVTAALERYGR